MTMPEPPWWVTYGMWSLLFFMFGILASSLADVFVALSKLAVKRWDRA